MISKSKLLDKYLNLLLIFLFPAQLALHFWPGSAFIFGIRVDYLSPAIYLTDVLFVLLFVLWFIKTRTKVTTDLKKNRYFLAIFLLFLILNLVVSQSFPVSLFKWLKIIEFIALGYYFKERRDIFTISNIASTIFYSLLFFSFIGLLQYINGKTSGNLFYLLGERSFSIFTPGIALVNILGRNFLRVYSTFPHPNSFAGFLGVSIIFLTLNRFTKNSLIKIVGLAIMFLTFVLTFSLSAYIGIAVCLCFYLLFRKFIFRKTIYNLLLIFVLLASLYLSFFSRPMLNSKVDFSQSVGQRLELANISGKIFSENWLTGTGLNTFIIKEISFAASEKGVWILQPVHNIYLLIFTETGISGIILLCFLLSRLFTKHIYSKNIWGFLIIVFVLVTGLFDHYWFTIQQNMLLLSLFSGISFREKI